MIHFAQRQAVTNMEQVVVGAQTSCQMDHTTVFICGVIALFTGLAPLLIVHQQFTIALSGSNDILSVYF